jgi:hypothetical protein
MQLKYRIPVLQYLLKEPQNHIIKLSLSLLTSKQLKMTAFFEHQKLNFKKDYLRNLITLASSDGNFDGTEKLLIHKIGLKKGLKEWQITALLNEDFSREFFIPAETRNRYALLYDVMQLIMNDYRIDSREQEFLSYVLQKLDLEHIKPMVIDLFKHGAPEPSEWNAFVEELELITDKKLS